MRALVIANGEPPSGSLLRELAGAADLVVGADGGGDTALERGVEPNFVVGDLDSLNAEAKERLGPARLVRDTDPDRTDLQKAIEFAIARGCDEVDIAGASGGRADHALANLSVLFVYRERARLRLIDDFFEVSAIDGEATVEAPAGTLVSLVAIGPATGVTTRGLRWDLENHTLTFSPYGIHNEVARPPATVTVATGDVLLFKGRFIERHA
jgi:thiamine pyrophosphokinase